MVHMCGLSIATSIRLLLAWGNQKSEQFRESCFLIVKGTLPSHESSTFHHCWEKLLYKTGGMYFILFKKRKIKTLLSLHSFSHSFFSFYSNYNDIVDIGIKQITVRDNVYIFIIL